MDESQQKEQHSINYFSSICERAGMRYISNPHDEDSTDGFVRKRDPSDGKEEDHIFFRVQLKCTSSQNLYKDYGDKIKYQLKAKNYNDLCKETNVPIILVLCILPAEKELWTDHDKSGDGKVILAGNLYWAEFSGNERTENKDSVTVSIDKKNILDKNSLRELLKRIGKKESLNSSSVKMSLQNHEQQKGNDKGAAERFKNESVKEEIDFPITGINFKRGYFPDGNVLHNGHIEYFPSIIAATPFNFLYFLISGEESGIAVALGEIFAEQSQQRTVWKEYTIQNFLNKTAEQLNEERKEEKVGILVCMYRNEINYMELLIQTWRQDMAEIPMVVNICIRDKKGMEAAERIKASEHIEATECIRAAEYIKTAECIKAILQEIDWGQEFENRQTEIESLILIQTDRYSIRQNGMDPDRNSGDKLQRWRVWLSDRYYFSQVLNHCGTPWANYLMCQRIPFCKGAELVEADRRLRERCDRERFIKQTYMWEEY